MKKRLRSLYLHQKGRVLVLNMLFFLLTIAPIVISQPFFQTNEDTTTTGLVIVSPKVVAIDSFDESTLYFDILNSTFAKMDNTKASCIYSVADHHGHLKTNGNLTYIANYKFWHFNMSEENTNETGFYNYYVYCNSTTENGYYSSNFEVSSNGLPHDDEFYLIAVAIVLIGACVILLKFGSSIDAESEWSQPLKLLVNMVALFVLLAGIGWSIQVQKVVGGLDSTLPNITTAVLIAVGFVIIPVLLFFLVLFIQHLLQFYYTLKKGRDFG